MTDPTTPLPERSPDALREFIDSHLLWCIEAADLLYRGRRFTVEDHIRRRLTVLSDTYPDTEDVSAETKQQKHARILAMLRQGEEDS